jgi:hypothetical protein
MFENLELIYSIGTKNVPSFANIFLLQTVDLFFPALIDFII